MIEKKIAKILLVPYAKNCNLTNDIIINNMKQAQPV